MSIYASGILCTYFMTYLLAYYIIQKQQVLPFKEPLLAAHICCNK